LANPFILLREPGAMDDDKSDRARELVERDREESD